MYIIAVGWAYVVGMLALGADSLGAGLALCLGLGVSPVLLLAYFARSRAHLRQSVRVTSERLHHEDGAHAQADQQHLLQGRTQFRAPVQSGDEVGDGNVDHAGGDETEQ